MDARAEYSKEVEPRETGFVPGFAQGVVRALLPSGMEEAALNARLRWTPQRLRFGTLYTRRELESYRFEQILTLKYDRAARDHCRGRREQPENAANANALARPGLADDPENLAGVDIPTHAADSLNHSNLTMESDVKVIDRKHRRCRAGLCVRNHQVTWSAGDRRRRVDRHR